MHAQGDLVHPLDEDVSKCVSDQHEWTTCTMWRWSAVLINILMQIGFVKSTCHTDAVDQQFVCCTPTVLSNTGLHTRAVSQLETT